MVINKTQSYWIKVIDEETDKEKIIEVYVDNEKNIDAKRPLLEYYDRTEKTNNATIVYADKECKGNTYNIIKIEFGDTAGYRRTALTYPGELVANVGEALTSVLDKIKNMFSDFEYFYDVDGRFIF
jgi:hypothetical protein